MEEQKENQENLENKEEPKQDEPKPEEPKENTENTENNSQEQKPPEEPQNEIKQEENAEQKNEIKTEENIQPQNVEPKNEIKEKEEKEAKEAKEKIEQENAIKEQQQKQQKKKEENDRVISTIKEKIKQLNTSYDFSIQYLDLVHKIISNFDELTYEKINNSLSDCFNYLYFFKNSAELYSKFAEEIQNSNKLITFTDQKPKMTDNFLSNVMQNTQNIFYQNLNKFSIGLSKNIISKGPLSLLQEKKNQIEAVRKTHLKKYSELTDEKKKLEKKYKNYFKLFSSFVPELIQQKNLNLQPDPMPELIDAPDFVYIVKDFSDAINHLITKVLNFTKEAHNSMKQINDLFVDINNLLKNAISIYISESKIFFSAEVTKKFEEIEKYFKKYEENAKENNIFKLNLIFHNEQTKTNIYNLLQQYYSLLATSNRIKKELIADRNSFSIEKYTNIELFFNWFISVLPNELDITVNDLIIKKLEIKRDPGIFYKWKQALLVFTKQHHVILFDNIEGYKIDDIVKIFEMGKISFRRKEDKKKGLLFEIIADIKGKIMNFKGEYLFDALTIENLNQISELINNQ